jgi:hypothetical protein
MGIAALRFVPSFQIIAGLMANWYEAEAIPSRSLIFLGTKWKSHPT